MSRVLNQRVMFVVAIGLLLLSQSALAQVVANRALASRADLEALLGAQGISGRDRGVISRRLTDGDFKVGDRVLVTVRGEQALTDTFTVRTGPSLELPDMAPLPLHGLLRSELQSRLEAHVAQYIRTPSVTVEPLLRIGILGAVVRPGYHSVRADQPLGDLLTVAGGLAADGDLGKTRVTRDGTEYWPRQEVRRALASGQSLDALGLQGGDEMQVGRRGAGFGPTFGIITGVVGLTTTVILLTKH